MDFQIIVTGVQVKADGKVHFPATVQWDDDGAWVDVVDIPDEVTLPLAVVQGIADGPGTPTEKRAALADAIVDVVDSWPQVAATKKTELLADALPDPPVNLPFTL